MEKKNVVVLGGGFGGLRAALSLGKKLKSAGLKDRYRVVLVDRHEYHTYTPLLPDMAVPARRPADAVEEDKVARTFKQILEGRSVAFVHGEVQALDLERGDIHLVHGEELACNYLVLAPGSEANYFGIPGLQENSLSLKTFEDARRLRDTLNELLARNPTARIAVGGGGPTGIEVASELKHSYRKAQVCIIEAMPTLLTGFSSRILKAAEKRLHKLGVDLIVNEPIAKVEPGQATTKNGRAIPFDLMIWTGGVKAPAFLATLPLKTEPRGRVEVAPAMMCLPQNLDLKLQPMVYALGDSVCVYDPKTGKPLPGVAPTAIEQGEIAARNIFADIHNSEDPKHKLKHAIYRPKNHPYVLIVGGRWGVAKIGALLITGWPAWLFERIIRVHYWVSVKF